MPKKIRPVPEEMRDLGARIVESREARGLNQKELAERAKVDATVLNRIEKRKQSNVTAAFVVQVAKALRCSTDSLLVGRDTAANAPTVIAEAGVPSDLVAATVGQVMAQVVPLLLKRDQQERKASGPGRKLRGSKRDERKP